MADRAQKIRALAALAAATAALAAPVALARASAPEEGSVVQGTALEAPASALDPTPGPGPVKQGETLVPPATTTPV